MRLMASPGSSRVSSMVRILWLRGNSNISAERSELFPDPLAPQMSMVARLFTRYDSIPAVLGSTVPFAISLDSVQGREERFLIATALPLGLRGYPTTVTLASYPPKSVSRTGSLWQNLRPLSRFRMLTRLSISLSSTMRFVRQRMWELRPSIPFMVTCTRFLEHGASM